MGLAAALLCACAAGVEDIETFDGAVGAGDADLEELDTGGEPQPDGLDAWPLVDASYAYPDVGIDDAPAEASTEDTGTPEAGASSDAAMPPSEAGTETDGGASADASSGSSDAGGRADASVDAGRSDASTDAGRDSGGGTTGGGTTDGGAPGGGGTPGGGTCNPDKCTNQCSIAAPFRCCSRDNRCGCSWFSVAYCND